MITIIYLSVNKLMERSHKKLVQHMVLMQTVFSTPPMISVQDVQRGFDSIYYHGHLRHSRLTFNQTPMSVDQLQQ